MALHILRNKDPLPDLGRQYHHYATVESCRKTGLGSLFGPKPGTVRMARDCDPAYPVFQVTPPRWYNGRNKERQTLAACYRDVLSAAARLQCDALVLPLITAGDPDFPAWLDFQVAAETAEDLLRNVPMDVYLLASQPAFRMPELLKDVELFLSRNFLDMDLLWSSQPFASQDARFATLVPEPMESGFSMDYSAGYGEWEASSHEVYESCEPCPPSSGFSRDTGALPVIPELPELDAGFSETLLALIDKTGKKDSEIYNKANVSRQHFSKIRNNPNYKPTKPTAVAFAIALELDMEQTLDLIGRAGYTLTRSSRFDVIIMYFIQNRNYNLFDINDTLYEFDQSLLGI